MREVGMRTVGRRLRRGAGRWGGGDRGSAAPLLALIVLAAGGLVLGLGRMGGTAAEAAQARTAADAAALAGAAGGRPAAEDLAAGNGGRLVELVEDGDEVEVLVEVGGARARARARRVVMPPAFPVAGATAGRAGLQPALVAALAEAERLLGTPVPVTSGYRSPAKQQALWDRRASNPYPVARPGTSPHERGLAVDVPLAFVPRLRAVAGRAGLCQPLPTTDPVHFELCRPSRG